VFSPWYAWSGRGDPGNHCAINLGLYGQRHRRWCMTERGARHVRRSATRFDVGPSSMAWEGDELVIRIREWAVPLPRPVRGEIRLRPQVLSGLETVLEAEGGHVWQPVAPLASVQVRMEEPGLNWDGSGYLDSNRGAEPLEAGFASWTWSRAHQEDGCTVLYDALPRRTGRRRAFGLHIDPGGQPSGFAAPPSQPLPGTIWQVPRETGCDSGHAPRLVSTFEDTPFYNRSRVHTWLRGAPADGFHESLDLDRFASPWVRMLLPVRMPRVA
jgi:carotenoid 1,2-hydratase